MKIVVLAGGTGGARFLRGVRAAAPEAEITVVVNTGDDVTMHGLRICPDLDTVMYTLGGGIDEERGWGRAGESWTVKAELAAYDADPSWFGLGDRDLATHLIRTRMLDAGLPAVGGHHRARRPLAARCDVAADERPAGGDPRRRHRPGHRPSAGDPLPGVVGAAPRGPRPVGLRAGRRRRRPARPRRDRGVRRRRRRPAGAVEPGRVRSARSSGCPACGRRC